MDVKKYFNASQAAEYLGVHRPRFYLMKDDWGLETAFQIGRIKMYKVKDVEQMGRDYEHTK